MKNYTDVEQSKKLAEILPQESADYTWARTAVPSTTLYYPEKLQYSFKDIPIIYYSGIGIPCWSLATLLEIIPHAVVEKFDDTIYVVSAFDKDRKTFFGGEESENLIDACVNLIINLREDSII